MCVQNHIKMWFPFICMHLLSLSTGPGVNGVGNTRGPQIQQNHGSSWKWGLQPGETLDGEEISWPNYIMLINVIYIHIWPCIHKSKFQSTSKKSKTHRRSPWDGDGGRGGEREREKEKIKNENDKDASPCVHKETWLGPFEHVKTDSRVNLLSRRSQELENLDDFLDGIMADLEEEMLHAMPWLPWTLAQLEKCWISRNDLPASSHIYVVLCPESLHSSISSSPGSKECAKRTCEPLFPIKIKHIQTWSTRFQHVTPQKDEDEDEDMDELKWSPEAG